MIKLATTTAYTIKEAAAMMDVSTYTIRRYIKDGKLRAQKVGAVWYITDKTLTELVAGEYKGSESI